MPQTRSSLAHRSHAWLLAALLVPALAHAQVAPTAPRQLIDKLGIEIRHRLEDPKSGKTSDEAEQDVAQHIVTLIRSSQGHLSLTDPDSSGSTPLMLAVSGGYPRVVRALLADPSVRLQINARNAAGETAWMLANFAPGVTLAACQPGALTVERLPLMPPYLRRMSDLLQNDVKGLSSIVQALEGAGAETDAAAATRAWLARCPNAPEELRQTLTEGAPLLPTLVKEAVAAQLKFNESYTAGLPSTPEKPPAGMRFLAAGEPWVPSDKPPRPAQPLLQLSSMRCTKMPKPSLGNSIRWSGTLLLRAVVSTRAGVIEVADIEAKRRDPEDRAAADFFRVVILRALGGYECEGDHVFEQEFQFKVG